MRNRTHTKITINHIFSDFQAGEMEVKNPLFQDDPTPAPVTPVKPTQEEDKK